jgi:hypothetical protein
VKKQSFSTEIWPAFADLRLIIVKSQQMAAKYWSYQQMGTFRRCCCIGVNKAMSAWSEQFRRPRQSGAAALLLQLD